MAFLALFDGEATVFARRLFVDAAVVFPTALLDGVGFLGVAGGVGKPFVAARASCPAEPPATSTSPLYQ